MALEYEENTDHSEEEKNVDFDTLNGSDEEAELLRMEAEIEKKLVEEARAAESKDSLPVKEKIYNKAALLAHAMDVYSGKEMPWIETLDMCEVPLALDDVHDDLKREVCFYNNTLAAVKSSKEMLKNLGVAYKRPLDYFAEMLKTDQHMAKVKDKLIYEQKKISVVEERKKSQAHKKVAKQVMAEKVKQRSQEKKQTLEGIKQWKKRGRSEGLGEKENDADLENLLKGNPKRSRNDSAIASKSRKRVAKDKKFGFGGKKKFAKSNDKKSTNDGRSFSRAKNNAGVGKRAVPAKSIKRRPGKDSRAKKRSHN